MYLCHANGEDDSIVNVLNCQLKNYGFELKDSVTVGNEEQFSSTEQTNRFKSRIEAGKYVIVILSDQLCADITALYELHHIMQLFLKKKIKVFTLVVKNRCIGIPNRLKWLLNTDLFELYDPIDLQSIILAALDCHLQDIRHNKEHDWEQNVLGQSFPYSDLFIIEMFRIYRNLNENDIKTKSTMIYTMYRYLEKTYKVSLEHIHYFKCVSYLFQYAGECIPSSARQVSVMEKCLALAFVEAKSVLSAQSY